MFDQIDGLVQFILKSFNFSFLVLLINMVMHVIFRIYYLFNIVV